MLKNNNKQQQQMVQYEEGEVMTQDVLLTACNNDLDLVQFFVEWIKNGKNATQAYMKFHPNVTYGSARTMGGQYLARIDKTLIMSAYGINAELYFKQLLDGMSAEQWNDFTGEREPDHRTRRVYHDKVGQLLGIETKEAASPQINIQNVVQSWVKGASDDS